MRFCEKRREAIKREESTVEEARNDVSVDF
jgi:hypothetical protein